MGKEGHAGARTPNLCSPSSSVTAEGLGEVTLGLESHCPRSALRSKQTLLFYMYIHTPFPERCWGPGKITEYLVTVSIPQHAAALRGLTEPPGNSAT